MQRKRQTESGATAIEWLITICALSVVAVLVVGVPTLLMGNMWYKDNSVLEAIRLQDEGAVSIEHTRRNVWAYSEIHYKRGDGTNKKALLDTNILYNYDIVMISEK